MQTATTNLASEESQIDPGWNVIVHDDNEHTNLFVIKVFFDILNLSIVDCVGLVDEIMTYGETIVAGPMSKSEASDICTKLKNCGGDNIMISRGIPSGGLYAVISRV